MPINWKLLRLRLLEAGLRALDVRRRRILAMRAMMATGVEAFTFTRDGVVWNVPGFDPIGFHLFADGAFQGDEMAALQAWSRHFQIFSGRRDTFVDVGAHIGTTCIPFVRQTGCRALAIEPIAENFRSLALNVQANGLGERIRLTQRAVLRAPGARTMWVTGAGAGGNFVRRDGVNDLPQTVTGEEEVVADTLSAIIAAAGLSAAQIALVWADVQGCESEVIESGADLWKAGVPLWAEVEPASLALQGYRATFSGLAAQHFDRFITASDLLRARENAPARPIAELEAVIRGIGSDVNIDALFLPPQCAPELSVEGPSASRARDSATGSVLAPPVSPLARRKRTSAAGRS